MTTWGRILGGLVLVLLLAGGFLLGSHPVIRDVTTDPADPPLLAHPEVSPDLATVPSEEVRRALEAHHSELRPLVVPGESASALVPRVREVLAAAGLEVSELGGAASPREALVHAVATTRWMRFRDDVLVRLRQAGGESGDQGAAIRIDLRSASRVGKSDLGTNGLRLRDLRARLESALMR